MPRARTSASARADYDRLPGVDLTIAPVDLPGARDRWSMTTKREWEHFRMSVAARAIRAAEVHLAVRYFDLVDTETRLWRQYEATTTPRDARDVLVNAHQVHRMLLSLGREIGVSPLARRNLAITETAGKVSRLDKFNAEPFRDATDDEKARD